MINQFGNCYTLEPLGRDEVPAWIEGLDGAFRPIEASSIDEMRVAIEIEQKAIAYHQSRAFAFGLHLRRLEANQS